MYCKRFSKEGIGMQKSNVTVVTNNQQQLSVELVVMKGPVKTRSQ